MANLNTKYPIKLSGQNTLAKYMKEDTFSALSIKGKRSFVNVIPAKYFNEDIKIGLQYDGMHNSPKNFKISNRRVILDRRNEVNASYDISFYLKDVDEFSNTFYTGGQYSLFYRINDSSGFDVGGYERKPSIGSSGEPNNRKSLDLTKGDHAITITRISENNRFTFFDLLKWGAPAKFYLDMELLGIVEGKHTVSFLERPPVNTGLITSNKLTLTAQSYSPVLGDYTLGGDISKHLSNIEGKISSMNDFYKIDWR